MLVLSFQQSDLLLDHSPCSHYDRVRIQTLALSGLVSQAVALRLSGFPPAYLLVEEGRFVIASLDEVGFFGSISGSFLLALVAAPESND